MGDRNELKVGVLAAAFVFGTATGAYADQPVATWQGGYAGVQIGQLSSSLAIDYSQGGNGTSAFLSTASPDPGDVVGGLFGGFNWHGTGPLVFGVEGEFNWSHAEGSADEIEIISSTPGLNLGSYETSINESAALRGRLGYASGSSLLYVSAGLAYIQYDVAYDNPPPPCRAATLTAG